VPQPPVGALEPPVGPLEAPASPPHPHDREVADPFGREHKPLLKRITGALAVIGAAIAKFAAQFKALLLLAPKLKLLTTSGTMLVSIAAYSFVFGWPFAVGFVALLLVHETGHLTVAASQGEVRPLKGTGKTRQEPRADLAHKSQKSQDIADSNREKAERKYDDVTPHGETQSSGPPNHFTGGNYVLLKCP